MTVRPAHPAVIVVPPLRGVPDRAYTPDDPRGPHHLIVDHENTLPLADHECAHGRLPTDRTPPCGCWPTDPRRLDSLYRYGVRDEATRAAHAEVERRRYARKVGRPVLPRQRCKGCRCLLDERTPGCRRCLNRHLMRRARAAAYASDRSRLDAAAKGASARPGVLKGAAGECCPTSLVGQPAA